jgi:hypothetical protein
MRITVVVLTLVARAVSRIPLPSVSGQQTTREPFVLAALYKRFVRWAAKGVWVDLVHALASASGPPAQVLIDSSAVKAHRSASGAKAGSERG